ncbi:hypothetical protein JRO89_XS03G0240800 [Xanthoceras sorbifolium]|uniref:Peptidase A1 domain-containing protein n=1 Tax=Xanthoceras sorbifolium TaxID=99658 RepID=A0ABQ8IBK9_9ROSI|nr:hypothetical protein JRO89_XS03G0240800 [Xanthoceras sorbifolium]
MLEAPILDSTGYITFGKHDNLNNKYIKFTPIPTTPQQSQFYDVVITGISVAGKKLLIKSSVFTRGGAIIDSGTVITRLPPEAYTALRSAFRKEMARYKLAAPDEIIDSTCYDFSSYETVVRSVQVVYDVEGGRVGFGPGTFSSVLLCQFPGHWGLRKVEDLDQFVRNKVPYA